MLLSSTPVIGKPHVALGLVHGFSIQALGLGNQWAADWAALFGTNSALTDIAEKYLDCKRNALKLMQTDATTQFGNAVGAIVGVQVQLSEILMSGGKDTILVCNVCGTAVRLKHKKPNVLQRLSKRVHPAREQPARVEPARVEQQPERAQLNKGGGRTRRKIFRTSTRQYAHHHRRSLRRPVSGRRRT